MYKKPYHQEIVLIVGFRWSQLRATGGSIVYRPQEITEAHNVKCILLIDFIYILLQYSMLRSIKAVQFVECSNELSAHFAV